MPLLVVPDNMNRKPVPRLQTKTDSVLLALLRLVHVLHVPLQPFAPLAVLGFTWPVPTLAQLVPPAWPINMSLKPALQLAIKIDNVPIVLPIAQLVIPERIASLATLDFQSVRALALLIAL